MANISGTSPTVTWNNAAPRRLVPALIAVAAVVAALTLLTRHVFPSLMFADTEPDHVVPAQLRGVLDRYLTRYLPIFAVTGAILTSRSANNGRSADLVAVPGCPPPMAQPASASATAVGGGRHRVVVVGGGFAGLQVVRGLRRTSVDVTLIDRRNFHIFQPLLYQVATGSLAAGEIASPLRGILKRQQNARVVLGEVTGIDFVAQSVHVEYLANRDAKTSIPYDTLVVSAGATHAYFGHDEWQPLAPGLKTLEDAMEIRRRILSAFEAAEVEPNPERRRAWLTFAVVGGGPTGVELAGQIAEIARDTLRRDFRVIDPREAEILLIEANERVLNTFPQTLSVSAARALERLGVTLVLGRPVVDLDRESVTLQAAGSEPERIPARTVIWAAGVRASSLAESLGAASGAAVDRAGRVTVGPDLSLPGYPNVFALGDMVRVQDARGKSQMLPGVSPVAMQQGRYVARLIRARLDGKHHGAFTYREKGNVATIGRLKAVADIRGVHLSGTLAWLAWLVVHLFYLVGYQNRVLVFTRWTVSFLTRGRGARLIAGAGRHGVSVMPSGSALSNSAVRTAGFP